MIITYRTLKIYFSETRKRRDLNYETYFNPDIKYGLFYNPNVIDELISKGKSKNFYLKTFLFLMNNNIKDNQTRLSFVAYLNTKLFATDDYQEINSSETSCLTGKQISANVLAVKPLTNLQNNYYNLINIVYEEQIVIIFRPFFF